MTSRETNCNHTALAANDGRILSEPHSRVAVAQWWHWVNTRPLPVKELIIHDFAICQGDFFLLVLLIVTQRRKERISYARVVNCCVEECGLNITCKRFILLSDLVAQTPEIYRQLVYEHNGFVDGGLFRCDGGDLSEEINNFILSRQGIVLDSAAIGDSGMWRSLFAL